MVINFQRYIQENLALADVHTNDQPSDRPWDITVSDSRFYLRVLLQGSLGLGESYVEGYWDCEQLDEFFARILRNQIHEKVVPNNLTSVWEKFTSKIINLQTIVNSFHVGKHHYDLGNDLFENMLDKSMTYSCGYWQNANNLEQAQEAKLDLICRKLDLKAGMNLLDIGCGWGSFMKYAAQNYGVSCVGLTVSKEQKQLGEEKCQGLPIKFYLQDYRQFESDEQKFDRVVSVGMFEHVGYKNYPTFMGIVSKKLKPEGLFLLHTIGNLHSVTYTELWIKKYIFPNSMIPSFAQIAAAAEDYLVIEDIHNFGQDYDKTLMAWLDNFDKNWHKLASKYGKKFYRIWKYFLCSCAGSFRARHSQLWQIVFSKNGVLGGYNSVR
jgi:cyclopropane-fatty-acyl-phospholipid synthase